MKKRKQKKVVEQINKASDDALMRKLLLYGFLAITTLK